MNSSIIFILFIFFQCLILKIDSKFISFTNSKETYSKQYNNLINYIKESGGYINPKLFPNEISAENRFIKTKEKILRNEILYFAPEKILISKYNRIVSPYCIKGYGYQEEYDYECLVYFMTVDKYNLSSEFKPYYEYLPKLNESDFVFNFTEEEIELYKDTGINEGIETYKRFLKKALEPVEDKLKIFAKKNKIEFNQIIKEFKDNFMMVGTRNFGRPGSIFDISTMVPFLDLINHSDKNNTHWYYDEEKKGYFLVAMRDIEKNEEITDSYGKYYNSLLYKTYGFVIPGNSLHDHVYNKINGTSYYLNIDYKYDTIWCMFDRLINEKQCDKNEAKKIILDSLNSKKNYYLKLQNYKKSRMPMKIIVKEHLEIIDEFISEVKKYEFRKKK